MRRLLPKTYARLFVAALDETPADKVSELSDRFLQMIRTHRDMRKASRILSAIEQLLHERDGVVPATVVSSRPLAPDARSIVEKKLHTMTGKKITLKEYHDQEVIGGARIRIGDVLIDGTVQGKLDQLQRSFE